MTLHEIQPDHYWSTLGTHDPILTIRPGDTVRTTTVDARGYDQDGRQVATGPNPMTGPFQIMGALPGDALKIRIERIWPNRAHGWSRNVIAGNVLDPDYIPHLPTRDDSNLLTSWQVDMDEGTVRIVSESPDEYPALAVDPMIGCFGVAPAHGEAISTATSSFHGGNMDYVGFRAGTEVLFPVAVEGALFFLGDVHARQGDGEIVGTGIEISSEVRFQVELLKGLNIVWPRGMDSEFIFTAGNARPLDQATQHATTEMSRWLCEDLGMDLVRAHTMMGQCVKYDLGNMYDPAYTMICKMAKSDLAAWGVEFTG